MSFYIGIRQEDKYLMEKRAALTPRHVAQLVRHYKLDFVVEHSGKRIFKDEEYLAAGAEIAEDLKKCSIIFGVKEVPIEVFEPGKTYVFFSHVIKGQPKNMPMLKKMMELKCNLIDYERVVDEQNKRLIAFGRYAGLAGMINSLWAWGLRMKELGYETRVQKIKQAHEYNSLKDARKDISDIGELIAEKGIARELWPFIIGFTGYGNVSQGAQEICGLLPVKEISPANLLELRNRKGLPNNIVYKVIFKEEDLVEPNDPVKEFDLQDYYRHPERYHSVFERYAPYLSMLINCIYWDARYPKLLTKEFLKSLYSEGQPKLMVVGDISCDINGSVECTVKSTEIQDPLFVYNPLTGEVSDGYKGFGILDMAVDILPAELPRDASNYFGDILVSFVKPIADADFELSFHDLDLPRAIKKGLILHQGELTPDFKYIEEYL